MVADWGSIPLRPMYISGTTPHGPVGSVQLQAPQLATVHAPDRTARLGAELHGAGRRPGGRGPRTGQQVSTRHDQPDSTFSSGPFGALCTPQSSDERSRGKTYDFHLFEPCEDLKPFFRHSGQQTTKNRGLSRDEQRTW